MRSHTVAHVFAALLNKETGALIIGNQLGEDHIHFDFNTKKFDRKLLEKHLAKANELLNKDIAAKSYELPREEAMKIPGVVKDGSSIPTKPCNTKNRRNRGI